MIKENQKLLNRIHVVSDAVIIIVSMFLAYFVRFYIFKNAEQSYPFNNYIILALACVPVLLFLYQQFHLYESMRNKSLTSEFCWFIVASAIGLLVSVSFLFIFKMFNFSRYALFFFYLFIILLGCAKRLILRLVLRHWRKKGFNLKNVLLIGSGKLACEYLLTVKTCPHYGYKIKGYIASQANLPSEDYLGGFDRLTKTIEENIYDEIVAALEVQEYDQLQTIIQLAEKSGTKLSIVPLYAKYVPVNFYLDEINTLPLVRIRYIPLDIMANAFVKRILDLVLSIVLLVLFLPVMLFAAIGTRVTSKGPIIFQQKRVGLNKNSFMLYKFRTMRLNDGQDCGWTSENDSRRTKFGAFLRKFSIDELPQLYNVMRGDMSLIGPRPELPKYVDEFKNCIPFYMVKHQVRPGMTGWAQVNGYRGDTSIVTRIEHDLYYIENWSLALDIKILLMTAYRGFINNEKLVK